LRRRGPPPASASIRCRRRIGFAAVVRMVYRTRAFSHERSQTRSAITNAMRPGVSSRATAGLFGRRCRSDELLTTYAARPLGTGSGRSRATICARTGTARGLGVAQPESTQPEKRKDSDDHNHETHNVNDVIHDSSSPSRLVRLTTLEQRTDQHLKTAAYCRVRTSHARAPGPHRPGRALLAPAQHLRSDGRPLSCACISRAR
jgi:hypothetical protein